MRSELLSGIDIEKMKKASNSFYSKYLKRSIDVVLSLLGLIILSPLLLIIAIAIKVTSRGPVIFKQQRVGKNWKPFTLLKFRTMVKDAPSMGPQITGGDDPRITPIGKFLRKSKLDELPQLFNVLKGDMSLVGPRPEVEKYARAYPEAYTIILSMVKPGITDYAAIEFVDEESLLEGLSPNEREKVYLEKVLPPKIALYLKYVSEISFRTDIKILTETLLKIVHRRRKSQK